MDPLQDLSWAHFVGFHVGWGVHSLLYLAAGYHQSTPQIPPNSADFRDTTFMHEEDRWH